MLSSVLAAVARRFEQPAVIGQILTGVLLGPSVLGRLPGDLSGHLFPEHVLPYLNVLAQVAVVIFMFSVGYEIEFRALRGHGRAVPLIAAGALIVPMSLGMLCVLLFEPSFAAIGEDDQGRSFVLFMGVATSITALPVLAAIVRERNLAGTVSGTVATGAAAIMDVLAWLTLAAALIGTGHSGELSWPVRLLLIALFLAVMLAVVRPLLAWWSGRSQSILRNQLPIAFALAMGTAWATAKLGLHPVFGGLLAGVVMRGKGSTPDPDVLRTMDQAGSLLLPLFFVVTGFSLTIDAVHGHGLLLLAVITAIACAGKFGPAYSISRLSGLDSRQSATVATLVNTRGLTELIALNVGLEAGIIGERLFTTLVLMALLTTLMTGPLLALIKPLKTERTEAAERLTSS
ncbi:cation:proton antiporter [Actinomadura sp. 9N215]|uniref:cation:proton antiporter n=1 Tax=Actinomadura sp. 9N215 TaxID=3375150 RepID=UPI0037AA2AD3